MSSVHVITPVQYYGQKETDPYIRASILLDGADQPITLVDIRDIPSDEFRVGMRVPSGTWKPPADRDVSDLGNRYGGSWEAAIERGSPRGAASIPDRCRSSRRRLPATSRSSRPRRRARTGVRRLRPKLIMRCVNDVLERTGLDRNVQFTIAGSCDYLSGMPFAFVMNIDGVGAWPPVYESHVEMDGRRGRCSKPGCGCSWATSTSCVIGSGKSSPGRPARCSRSRPTT